MLCVASCAAPRIRASTIGLEQPFLAHTANVLIENMGDVVPRAARQRRADQANDHRRGGALRTNAGSRASSSWTVSWHACSARARRSCRGADAFRLHDTYGFPPDLTAKILSERELGIDESGYWEERKKAQQTARDNPKFRREAQAELWGSAELPQTGFTGYGELHALGRVLAIAMDGVFEDSASEGDTVQLAFDHTTFYAESGGQVGDSGVARGTDVALRIDDVQ